MKGALFLAIGLVGQVSVAGLSEQALQRTLDELRARNQRAEKKIALLEQKLEDLAVSNIQMPSICNGRLTLTSGTPITISDTTSSTLYFTPYRGNRVTLYDGTRWSMHSFSEISLSLTITSGKNYDVFVYSNSGTLTLELSAAWAGDTSRTDALTTLNGVYVKSADNTRRYLGTIRASASNTVADSRATRLLWNAYNRVSKLVYITHSTGSWSYTTAIFRPSNNDTTKFVGVVTGLAEQTFYTKIAQLISTGGAAFFIGVCPNCTASTGAGYGYIANAASQMVQAHFYEMPAAGYNYYQWTELGNAGTITVYGNADQSTMMGVVEC